MASEAQKELFAKLMGEKQLPPEVTETPEQLIERFNGLDQTSASDWIEKALTLERKGATPPPF